MRLSTNKLRIGTAAARLWPWFVIPQPAIQAKIGEQWSDCTVFSRFHFCISCRHHTSELLAKNPWEASFGKSPAPDVNIFLKIKEHWNEIDTSLEIRTVKIPSEKREELLDLFNCLLEKGEFIRGDYKELAEISITMLGGTLPAGKAMVWKKPGPCHKARFMAFGLLVLKIFAFSSCEGSLSL